MTCDICGKERHSLQTFRIGGPDSDETVAVCFFCVKENERNRWKPLPEEREIEEVTSHGE